MSNNTLSHKQVTNASTSQSHHSPAIATTTTSDETVVAMNAGADTHAATGAQQSTSHSSSPTSASTDTAGAVECRQSVILAPARLALNTAGAANLPALNSADGYNGANQTQNNYFSNNFGQNCAPVLADSPFTTSTSSSATSASTDTTGATTTTTTAGAHNKSLLRPSVLRLADSSTNAVDTQSDTQKETKVITFVSLSKEDISRPVPTLLPSAIDSMIIRCGADTTTSSLNGSAACDDSMASCPSFATISSSATTACGAPVVTSTSTAFGGDAATISAFVAAVQPASDPSAAAGDDSNSQSAFVFGQNLEERAVFKHRRHADSHEAGADTNGADQSSPESGENGGQSSGGCASTSCGGEQTSVIKTTSDGVLDLSATGTTGALDMTPTSSAEKSSSSADNKRKFEVITGEEDEQNVLSMHCRLYQWETDTWKERGRGCLRLNDAIKDEKLCSRIVMRTSGALRVILNAHVVKGMRFEMSNDHCLRFTNVDGIYIIKGAPKDIDQLNSAIDYRLREISKRHKTSDEVTDDEEEEYEDVKTKNADIAAKVHTIEDMSNDC